jgi:TolA-binding protein
LLKVLDYTHSFKTDDALLMLGKCYKNLGALSDARQYLSILLRDYPDSEYVQQASNLIEKLN